MGVYKKLLAIQQAVDFAKKDGKGDKYTYSTGNEVLGLIRPLMNKHGLILKQEVIDIKNQRQDYVTSRGYEKHEMFTSIGLRFTWVDVETGETDVNLFSSNGQNDWEKGLGSALTYGERYFLLKFFHIPTEEDDPDNKNRKSSQGYKEETADSAKSYSKRVKPDERPWLNLTTKDGQETAKYLELKRYLLEGGELTYERIEKDYRISRKTAELLAKDFGIKKKN